ncbi:MAG: alpha-E domain-containing protein [Burkholderiaceae bacterium]
MLSRTADHLFWMARYVERAENTARMLDVNLQTSLLPQSEKNAAEGWRALLGISELQARYDKQHDQLTAREVIDFMVRDPSNSSSIYSCIRRARENARAVRGSLTTEVWETSNATWLELNNLLATKSLDRDPSDFFEWVKFRSHLSRGVMIGTMLKDEAFHFARMGTFLERADNTARLLDVKYHGMAELGRLVEPTAVERNETQASSQASSQGDFYYWAAVLRSVSAFEIYRRVYSDLITPARVAELMILRSDMPRSLSACINEVVINLAAVRNQQSQDTERRAGMLRAELAFGRIDDILQAGLHAWLTNFLERVNNLGAGISRNFLVWNS